MAVQADGPILLRSAMIENLRVCDRGGQHRVFFVCLGEQPRNLNIFDGLGTI